LLAGLKEILKQVAIQSCASGCTVYSVLKWRREWDGMRADLGTESYNVNADYDKIGAAYKYCICGKGIYHNYTMCY